MKISSSIATFAALVILGATLGIPAARAVNSCVDEAQQDFHECKGACIEGFQASKDACVGRDHDCVEACRLDRAVCRDASGIDDAIAACNATLADAKQACRANFPPGSAALDHCIDQAQVVAFQCRDHARDVAQPALRECRREFKHCVVACPKTPGSQDPKACIAAAKAGELACSATCTENLQAAKDLCRNRNHACVEGCRATRDACTRPILDQLEAAITGCNTERDSDVTACKIAFPPGPARDQCIDNAQVEAFMCKDDAREAAAPGLKQCQDAFQACAQACPPAP